MNLLRKLFPQSFRIMKPGPNRTLITAIRTWHQDDNPDNFDKIIGILMSDEAMLFLPSVQHEAPQVKAEAELNMLLKLTCIQEQDGVKTLTAFTDEDVLYERTKQRNYVRVPSRCVLESCLDNDVKKVIIISEGFDMFVLKWLES
jgi:hypothetical protein